MSIAEELRQIEEMYAHGTLTHDEFEQAKAKVLTAGESPTPAADSQTARQIAALQRQNAVAQLDREWEMEKEQYMVTGRYGSRSLPSEGGSLLGGLIIGGFGVFWTIFAFSITSGASAAGAPGIASVFPFFGILFVVVGIGSSINSYSKAGQYREAEQRYQEKRAQMLAESDET